jgi:leader peptidase (prepilin peptidase)/N-methyltransferase
MDSIWMGGWIFTSLWFLAPATVFWGSFLNQVADRTPPRDGSGLPWPPATGTPTLWRPSRSFCFSCGMRLAPRDLIPVLSYLWLRGRCRGCGGNIGRRSLAVELLTPILLQGWWRVASSLGASPLSLYLGFALLSWGTVAGVLAWEGRRFTRGFLALGALLAAGIPAMLAWGL